MMISNKKISKVWSYDMHINIYRNTPISYLARASAIAIFNYTGLLYYWNVCIGNSSLGELGNCYWNKRNTTTLFNQLCKLRCIDRYDTVTIDRYGNHSMCINVQGLPRYLGWFYSPSSTHVVTCSEAENLESLTHVTNTREGRKIQLADGLGQ